jgi:hypothetical protein
MRRRDVRYRSRQTSYATRWIAYDPLAWIFGCHGKERRADAPRLRPDGERTDHCQLWFDAGRVSHVTPCLLAHF